MYRLLLALLIAAPAAAQAPISLADARAGGAGQTVTVAGRITVANQFGGPAYLQDGTGGITVFYAPLYTTVSLGDSVVVTGTTVEAFAGAQAGSGLLQIQSSGASFRVVSSGAAPAPRRLAVADVDESVEGQLIRLSGVRVVGAAERFAGNTFYVLRGSDGAQVELFVDRDTDVPGLSVPTDTFSVVAAVSHFQGRRLVLPRSAGDLILASGLQPPGTLSTIAALREAGNGRTATVAGRITVAGQFAGSGAPGGPIYFQDATGGIAFYDDELAVIRQAQIGDSLVLTGSTTEFQPSEDDDGAALQGTGLFQISGSVTAQLVQSGTRLMTPRPVAIADVGEAVEGQLVRLQGVRLKTQRVALPSNDEVTVTDDSGAEVEVRIDGDTNLAGANAPTGDFDVVGVVSQFRGRYQILPRTVEDLGVEEFSFPGEDIPLSATFEVATWNIENFGSPSRDPVSDEDQLAGAIRTIQIVDADLYGVQEIANADLFQDLVDGLDGYRGFLAPFTSGTAVQQRTGFLYRTSVIDSVSSGLLFDTPGDNPQGRLAWASGRWPFGFTFDATIDGETRRITAVTIHAKAIQTTADRTRREDDSAQLKSFLDANYADANVVLLGDYNDDVDVSNVRGLPSPYANFTSDAQSYRIVTASLSERSVATISGGSTIDHILITDELFDEYFEGTERAENIGSQVSNFVSTVSDHFPVWVRFDFGTAVSTSAPVASRLDVSAARPNPTASAFSIDVSQPATISVYDVLGRQLRTLVAQAGTVRIDVSDLPSGLYLVRVESGSSVVTRTVVRAAR